MLSAQAPATITPNTPNVSPAQVQDGLVTFDVETNLFAVTVHGESKELEGKVRVHEGTEGLTLEQLEAVVPVDSLSTGMKLRDNHMRKYIFETPQGEAPDVRFTAERAECSPLDANNQSTCVASGMLAIRGTARPFVIELSVRRENDLFRVQGDGDVKLSAYGIERPSQFGVKTADVVKLHLELSARTTAAAGALSAGNKR
jgi:polyisoprenoid-binding protein YceI